MKVVDEKVEQEQAKQLKEHFEEGSAAAATTGARKGMNNKELKQLVKEYEKERKKEKNLK